MKFGMALVCFGMILILSTSLLCVIMGFTMALDKNNFKKVETKCYDKYSHEIKGQVCYKTVPKNTNEFFNNYVVTTFSIGLVSVFIGLLLFVILEEYKE